MNLIKSPNITSIGKYIIIVILTMVITLIFCSKDRTTYHPQYIVMDTIKYKYIDENNRLRGQIEQKELNISKQSNIIDSLSKLIKNTKPKDIKGITIIDTRIDTHFVTETIVKDTVFIVSKKDKYIDLLVQSSQHTSLVDIKLWDSLTITEIHKKRLFKSERKIDISHSSPYFKTQLAASYRVKDNYPKITIGPSIGIGYDGYQIRPNIGISVQFPLIKIK